MMFRCALFAAFVCTASAQLGFDDSDALATVGMNNETCASEPCNVAGPPQICKDIGNATDPSFECFCKDDMTVHMIDHPATCPEPKPAPPADKKSKKHVVAIVIGVIAAVLAAIGAFFFIRSRSSRTKIPEQENLISHHDPNMNQVVDSTPVRNQELRRSVFDPESGTSKSVNAAAADTTVLAE
eukprot:Rhum_TRINITY_DN14409_c13_g1::Rhum_TRINITY_DN14409_c13_g1_i1::g.88400::m.88400